MSDEQILSPRKVTVGFKRSIQVRQFEPAEASIFIEADVPLNATAEQLVEAAQSAFFQAKTTVLEQLGLAFEVSIDGRAVEVMEQQLGATVESTAPAKKSAAPRSQSSSTGANKSTTDKRTLAEELVSHPEKWFDNREDGERRQDGRPEFRRKGTGQGLWLRSQDGSTPDYWEGLDIPAAGSFR